MAFDATTEITQSIQESRTVTLYPDTQAEAREMLEALGAHAADDCDTWTHQSGSGYSGPESAGHYDVWGSDDGSEWRIRIVAAELS